MKRGISKYDALFGNYFYEQSFYILRHVLTLYQVAIEETNMKGQSTIETFILVKIVRNLS